MKKILIILLVTLFIAGCGTEESTSAEPGALVSVSTDSTVGVLLDEIPSSIREDLASDLLKKPNHFWIERAKAQLRLANYRLVYRTDFYEEEKQSLPLPPESVWGIEIKGLPRREEVEGHDLVVVDYLFTSTILASNDVGLSEPNLGVVEGFWNEPFVFPLDPEFLFQRTGFACLDEAEFPPHSVDPEEVDGFYDQECDVEEELSNEGCHQTEMPEQSCVDALIGKIGKMETDILFTRLAWNQELADKVRVGIVNNPDGADLVTYEEDFRTNRANYRYIEMNSCTLLENCVGGTGWRRLLQFATSDINAGGKDLLIGEVDYFVSGEGSELSRQGIFEYSACHDHYHFAHYGLLSYGDTKKNINFKQGFCLQSTSRPYNNEFSPLYNNYAGCEYQGIGSGWADQYKIGLDCQWLDVTEVDAKQPVTKEITFFSNPDKFLCEGNHVLDAEGNQIYEPTGFKTEEGKPVFRPQCEFTPGALENNADSYRITLPKEDEGYVTEGCKNNEISPTRNCGFTKLVEKNTCNPGSTVKLQCQLATPSAPQIVRICDYSNVLGTAIPCTYNGPFNAQSLANEIVETTTEVAFTCPTARDENELGGTYSIYIAPVNSDDAIGQVNCA